MSVFKLYLLKDEKFSSSSQIHSSKVGTKAEFIEKRLTATNALY